jgi:hypothetical protein
MARLHNRNGSLTELLEKFRWQGIHSFTNFNEIRKYHDSYSANVQEINKQGSELLEQNIQDIENQIEKETVDLDTNVRNHKSALILEKASLGNAIQEYTNNADIKSRLIHWIPLLLAKRRFNKLEHCLDIEVNRPFQKMITLIEQLKSELQDKKVNNEKWALFFVEKELMRAFTIKSVLDTNRSLYYGAEGEERALTELSALPDAYAIINDYRKKFPKPIYDRKNHDHISSIQVDHIVIGPTGLFLIETKNWSKKSVEREDFFSPIKQIRRSSFAVFVLVNKSIEDSRMSIFSSGWGSKKISPKNILLLMNNKPSEVFQFVQVVTLDEVRSYISKGPEIYSNEEVVQLESFFNATNESKFK